MGAKYVFFFGARAAEGNAPEEPVGGKGANLAEMCLLGIGPGRVHHLDGVLYGLLQRRLQTAGRR